MSVIRSATRFVGTALSVAGAAVLLAACDGGAEIRDQLGVARRAPDEFAVVTNAPLVVPPDYALRPPAPGAPPAQFNSPERVASDAVFGGTLTEGAAGGAPVGVGTTGQPSDIERQFLRAAGAENADPAIRATLNRETGALTEKSLDFAREIIGLTYDPTDIVVDAAEEARRLRQNAAQGLPPTTGDTPQIKRGEPGLLEGVF